MTPQATPSDESTTGHVYVNELLCYVIYAHKSNNDRFHREIILSKFDLDDIVESKNLLWSLGSNALIGRYPQRADSKYRKAVIAHIDDIFKAIGELDAVDNLPIFVAKDLSKVPDLQPEELNVLFFINRVKSLEAQVSQQREELVTINRYLSQIDDDQRRQLNKVEGQEEELASVNRDLAQVKQDLTRQFNEVKSQIQTQLGNIDSGVVTSNIINGNETTDEESTSESIPLCLCLIILVSIMLCYDGPRAPQPFRYDGPIGLHETSLGNLPFNGEETYDNDGEQQRPEQQQQQHQLEHQQTQQQDQQHQQQQEQDVIDGRDDSEDEVNHQDVDNVDQSCSQQQQRIEQHVQQYLQTQR